MAIELSSAQLLCFCSVFRSERNPLLAKTGREKGRGGGGGGMEEEASEGKEEATPYSSSSSVILVFVKLPLAG